MAKDAKNRKIALAFALIILGLVLIFGRKTTPTVTPSYTFESEPVKVDSLVNEYTTSDLEGTLPRRIVIPTLTVDLDVRKSEVINGYWEVFEDSAGWGTGSGLPGKNGNQVIFAHAREKLFLPLKDVEVGDGIYVLTDDDWYAYEVKEIKEVLPNQIEVIAPTEDETLTLYTCSGYQDSKRLIVVAKRV